MQRDRPVGSAESGKGLLRRSAADFSASRQRLLESEFGALLFGPGCLWRIYQMPEEFDGDRDYREAGIFEPELDALPIPKTPAYTGCAAAFHNNIARILALQSLAPDLIYYATRRAMLTCIAARNLGLEIVPLGAPADHILAKSDEMAAELVRLDAQDQKDRPDPNLNMAAAYEYGTRRIKELNEKQAADDPNAPTFVLGGIDAIYAAMIKSSYDAFETLAGDLWFEALNQRPALAARWAERGPNENKQVKLADLASHGFDMKMQMGDFLRKSRKASFQSLNDVLSHYSSAFGEQVLACFEPKAALTTVSSIRHLLTHRGGVVDQKFQKEFADTPRYRSLAIGSNLRFHGAEVRDHVRVCVEAAVRLFLFVDGWTADNAEA